MKAIYYRSIILLLLFTWLTKTVFSQVSDYKSIFNSDWEKAEAFISENESWMKSVCDKNDISFHFAAAIVFPELIRYSALRDRIEISMLKTLYINLGEEYADFSIGQFQMKPSFAEQIHEKISLLNDRKLRNMFKGKTSFRDLKEYRASVVEDLEDINSQIYYLIAFIKIFEFNYKEKWNNEAEKLKFCSTAYNCGLNKNLTYIESMSEKKFFRTGLIKSETYSYSDISLYWFDLNYKKGSE